MADHPADSTGPHSTIRTSESDQNILESFEKLLDKKLGKIESKLCIIEQRQETFQREQDKLCDKLLKVKNSVDDLNDLTDKETRKIKDEVYNVSDTLDGVSEKISDIKTDTRENLENIESTLDKVVKIHKHLKVQEVSNLIKSENPSENLTEDQTKLILNELKIIKNSLKNFKNSDDSTDKDIEDINLSITTLTNDIQEINKKIAQNEENTKLFHSFKEALDTNNEKMSAELKSTFLQFGNFSPRRNENSIVELCEKMNSFEDLLSKKTVELKKCIIEESTESLKVLQDTKNETKMSLLNTTNEILKNVPSKKEAITKTELKKIMENHGKNQNSADFIDLYTKIEVLKDDISKNFEDFLLKSKVSKPESPRIDDKISNLKSELEKTMFKVHLESIKEMSKLIKTLNFEPNFKALETKVEKSMTETKFTNKINSLSTEMKNSISESTKEIKNLETKLDKTVTEMKFMNKINSLGSEMKNSVSDCTLKISQKLDENHEDFAEKCDKICEKLETFNSLEPNLSSELKDLRSEIEANSALKKIKSLSKSIKEISKIQKSPEFPDFDEKFAKLQENCDKNLNSASEILNSVEDLKQLTSSVPSTVHELSPKIEKIEACLQSTSEDLTTKLRVLEGSVIDKNTKTHQESLEHIIKKFDMVENRFAVIRKYVKNYQGFGGHIPGNTLLLCSAFQFMRSNPYFP